MVKSRQRTVLLSVLLLWYCVARFLQLFADKIPILVIGVLQVLPITLFAILDGARLYGRRGIVVFTALVLGVATLFESLSLSTGFPFGHYRFTAMMGPKVHELPVAVALGYVGMGYLAWIIGLAILGYEEEPLTGRRVVLLPLMAGVAMTVWDLSMDPVWAGIDRAWVWQDGGSYFGVPVSNFFGWFLTVYVFYQLFAVYLRNRAVVSSATSPWHLPVLFYLASAAGNLLVFAPASLGTVFVDATGRGWPIEGILRASRLVSIFIMMPLGVIAWARSRPGDDFS